MAGKLTKNTLFLTSAYVGQKLFSFVYFSLIARFIGVESVGLYVTALSFSSLFSVFADLGLTQVLIREGSRDKNNLGKILSQTIIFKVFLLVLSYLVLNVVVWVMGYGGEIRQLIYVSGILMVLDSLSLSFYGVLRAKENLFFEAIGIVAGQIVIIVFGLLVVLWKLPLIFLLMALGMGSLFNFLYSFIMVYRQGVRIKFVGHFDLSFSLWKLSLPFALAGIFTKIYSYIDSVLLSFLVGTRNVGIYSIPNKIVFAFQFIPMAFAASLYPAMSQYFVSDKEKLRQTFEKAMVYLSILAFPLAVGIFIISDIFINSVYGFEYSSSIPALRILVFGLIFAFLDFPVGSLLNACNKQNIQTLAMGITMIVNIVLNIIFIPWWGANGSALAAVIGNLTLLAIGFANTPAIIGRLSNVYWQKIVKIISSAVLMGLFLSVVKKWLILLIVPVGLLKAFIFVVILISLGVLFYFSLLWITKVLPKKEVVELFSLRKKSSYVN